MLIGFVSCFGLRLYTSIAGVTTLPVYFDPSIVGIVCNVITMVVVSLMTTVTNEERKCRQDLFVIPETEKERKEMNRTLLYSKLSIGIGVFFTVMLLVLWVIPYTIGR